MGWAHLRLRWFLYFLCIFSLFRSTLGSHGSRRSERRILHSLWIEVNASCYHPFLSIKKCL